ncbi:MAG: hypothetical protein HC889_14060 [Synechococcaceae cyanobacterium SM1_2_3]|nr:hypothetical protein [Synechococcaceae cyanobacterium SM1_2_3]
MAEENNGPLANPPVPFDWSGWLAKFRHPGPAEIGILAGVAALLALLVAGALWLNTPSYNVLYRDLAERRGSDHGRPAESEYSRQD